MSDSASSLKRKCCKVCRYSVDNNGHGGNGQQSVNDEDWPSRFGGGIVVAEPDSQKENIAKVKGVAVTPWLILTISKLKKWKYLDKVEDDRTNGPED